MKKGKNIRLKLSGSSSGQHSLLIDKADIVELLKLKNHLETDLAVSKKRLDKFESGSNKSLLNCHTQGKKNFMKYINLYYPQLETSGNYFRRLVEKIEPYSYEDIMAGDFI